MLAEILQKKRIFELLWKIEEDLARETREKKCRHCGGPLNRSDDARRPLGRPKLPEEMERRISFCCGRRECRKRRNPASVLFSMINDRNLDYSPLEIIRIK